MNINGLFMYIGIVLVLFTMSSTSTSDALRHWFRCRNELRNECSDNNDCRSMEICRESRCVTACLEKKCDINEGCQIINHHVSACECLPGFQRDPKRKCVPSKICSDDTNCDFTEKCKNNKCIGVCFEKTCGVNEGCQVISHHTSSCECLPNFTRNSERICIPNRLCSVDTDCYSTEVCKATKCVSACFEKTCSILNEACQVNNRHSSSCHCLPGYNRNTITNECTPICAIDEDCPSYQNCLIINYVPTCQCQPGYTPGTNPSDPCLKMCTGDDSCEDDEKCVDNKCTDPCDSITCGDNASCGTTAHIGTCTCNDDFIGDPHTGCSRRCTVDDDCEDSEKCDSSNKCVNACASITCGSNQFCDATIHTGECKCEIGFTGDPTTGCI